MEKQEQCEFLLSRVRQMTDDSSVGRKVPFVGETLRGLDCADMMKLPSRQSQQLESCDVSDELVHESLWAKAEARTGQLVCFVLLLRHAEFENVCTVDASILLMFLDLEV